MIDALAYAVRDAIRAAKIGYGYVDCEIMEDERPAPRCGKFFAAVHGVDSACNSDNNLDERYSFTVTLTMRVTGSLDRAGDQELYRNAVRTLARQQGFYARADDLRNLLHMCWPIVVLQNRTPQSANDNLAAWSTGTVYGFVEPPRWRGMEFPRVVGGEWFGAEPDDPAVGVKSALRFGDCRRMQPQTQPGGPFA